MHFFRENQIFFRWYGHIYRDVLKCVTYFFLQNEHSRQLLKDIGITNTTVVGDTRFDRVIDIRKQAKSLPLVETFKDGRTVMVAGSSWAPDEDLIISYFNNHPTMKLILAPHVVNESHLKEIESKLKRPHLRYSKAEDLKSATADCLIIDCFGLLSSIYRYGELAYVGGGFGVGIHNVPEAAVYGVPVLVGPNNKKFREAQDLLKAGGCIEVTDKATYSQTMDRLLTDKPYRDSCGNISGKYIADNAGAADIIFKSVPF